MKKLILSYIASIFILPAAFCQSFYAPIHFPKFYTVSRAVYIKFFKDNKKMLFVDAKEGLSVNCDSVFQDKNDQETISDNLKPYFFNKYWDLHDHLIDKGILVFIPFDQNLDNWQEMISIQRIDAEGQSPKKLFKMIMKTREKRCPGKTKLEIIEESGKSIIYKAITDRCDAFDPQAELSIILAPPKLLMMQYTLWKVEYVVRNIDWEPMIDKEKLEWIKNIILLTGKELDVYTESD